MLCRMFPILLLLLGVLLALGRKRIFRRRCILAIRILGRLRHRGVESSVLLRSICVFQLGGKLLRVVCIVGTFPDVLSILRLALLFHTRDIQPFFSHPFMLIFLFGLGIGFRRRYSLLGSRLSFFRRRGLGVLC